METCSYDTTPPTSLAEDRTVDQVQTCFTCSPFLWGLVPLYFISNLPHLDLVAWHQ